MDFSNLPAYDPRRGGYLHKCGNITHMVNPAANKACYIFNGIPQYLELWGRWPFFSYDKNVCKCNCKAAVKSGLIELAEYSLNPDPKSDEYMGALWVPYSDLEATRRAIGFLLDRELIERTTSGRLNNMSMLTGVDFVQGKTRQNRSRPVKFSDLLDLNTGRWLPVFDEDWRQLLESTMLKGIGLT